MLKLSQQTAIRIVIVAVASIFVNAGCQSAENSAPRFAPLPTWTPDPNSAEILPSANTDSATTIELSPAPDNESSGPSEPVAQVGPAITFDAAVPGAVIAHVEAASRGQAGAIALAPGGDNVVGRWIYVVVGPFATVRDSIGFDELATAWQSGALLATESTVSAMIPLLGALPAENVPAIDNVTVYDQLWTGAADLAIVPFDTVVPALKVLQVDGASPFARPFTASEWPLRLDISASGDADSLARLADAGAITNRDDGKLTTVAMTGVTALVRATAYNMEINGLTWAGEEVADVLQSADYAHISNEVSFVPDCPYPNPIGGTSFCSDARYLELLEFIGTDIIELTGNHLNDFGAEYNNNSMELYAERGWLTFGGGRDLAEARQPLTIDAGNGNRIAFVGCNWFGPAYANATETSGGSRPCDATVNEDIARLDSEGYVVIATLQYVEHYFYQATGEQSADFRALADAGASAVSGSQGHHVQAFDFHNGAFIHYGLGNLFFDQMDQLGTRQALIDTYVIYDGRLISVDIFGGLIEDWARPRLMTDAERRDVLETLFAASGWEAR